MKSGFSMALRPVLMLACAAFLSQGPIAHAASVQDRHVKAIDLALAGDAKSASRLLRDLVKEKMPAGEKDHVQLSLGRVLYQTGDYKGALEAYAKVSSGSDAWFLALEERAWSHMQLDQPEEALAHLKTLLSPLFKEKASSEPYFLSALAQLRVCAYPALFKTLDLFKERFRDRVKSWEATAGLDPAAQTKLKKTRETIQKLNVVEAEAIQRLYIEEDPNNKQGSVPKIEKGSSQLSFPVVDNEEIWLDEVDNFKVRVSGCPQRDNAQAVNSASKGRSL